MKSASSQPPGRQRDRLRLLLVYGTIALTTGLATASLTLISPSLPAIQAELGIPMTKLSASQAVYLLCIAVPQLVYGSISDRIGRRRPLVLGMAIFVAGSVAATFATDFYSLTFARLLQAVGASSGMVISRGIMRDMHPEGRMASVMGFLAVAMTVIPMVAPALGGILQDSFGWAGNFWLLAGIGTLLAVATFMWIPDMASSDSVREPSSSSALRKILASRRFHYFALQIGLSSAMNQLFFVVVPFVMEREFAQSPSSYGFWLALPPFFYLLGNLASGRFAERAGTVRMTLFGTAGAGAACAVWCLVVGLLPPTAAVPFLAMASIAVFHGCVTPSAIAGSTGAIAAAYGLAAGVAGCIQALCAAALMILVSASVDNAFLLIWTLSAAAWLSVILAWMLKPRAAKAKSLDHGNE